MNHPSAMPHIDAGSPAAPVTLSPWDVQPLRSVHPADLESVNLRQSGEALKVCIHPQL